MSYLSETLMRLTKGLYPSGRAFRMPDNGVFKYFTKGYLLEVEKAYLNMLSVQNGFMPDNDDFTETDAAFQERRFGLAVNTEISLEERKQALIRKMNHPGTIKTRQNWRYVEYQLRLAGFDVYIFENRFLKETFNILTDWDNGTFENGVLPSEYINPDEIGIGIGFTDSTENPRTGLRSSAVSAQFDFTDVSDPNIWTRFAHGEKYTGALDRLPNWLNGQADGADTFRDGGGTYVNKNNLGLYTSDVDQILCNGNNNAYYGCLSPDFYDAYSISGQIFSSSVDNDAIGFVVSSVTIAGLEYTLSFVASAGGTLTDVNPAYAGSAAINSLLNADSFTVHMALVYNFGKADCEQIAVIDTGELEIDWNQIGDLDFKVDREGDIIKCSMVNWTIRTNDYSGVIDYDLNENVYTTKFIGANSIGFGFESQDGGGFKNISFNRLGGGLRSTNLIELKEGFEYELKGYAVYDQTGSFSYVADPEEATHFQMGFFDSAGVLINENVQYNQVKGNINSYTEVTARIEAVEDVEVFIGYFKGGDIASLGARRIFVDDITLIEVPIWLTKTPKEIAISPNTNIVQHGQFQHGATQHGQSYTYQIVNSIDNADDALFNVGDNFKSTFFISSDVLGINAVIPEAREVEFRQLVLKLKPVQTVAFPFISFTPPVESNQILEDDIELLELEDGTIIQLENSYE